MIIQCQSCSRKFIVKDSDITSKGRTVQCGYCSVTWHQMPQNSTPIVDKKIEEFEIDEIEITKVEKEVTTKELKASDGKIYKYLGNQWALLLPSGKTGIFAKKKITTELNKIAGIKKRKVKRKNKIKKEVDPSAESLDSDKKLPDVYKPKQGLGFFGYIFLLIIIGFSIVGILRTFENDLLNYFPQTEYIFELLDKQLEFFAETFKNMIVIINDLMSSY